MKCEEDAEPVSTPSPRRSQRFFQKNSPRALRALRFDRLSDLCRLAASRPQNAVRGGRRAGFNAELAEIAEILPEEFSARSACSAFRSSQRPPPPRCIPDLRMQCEEDAEPVSTPSSRRTPRFF